MISFFIGKCHSCFKKMACVCNISRVKVWQSNGIILTPNYTLLYISKDGHRTISASLQGKKDKKLQ